MARSLRLPFGLVLELRRAPGHVYDLTFRLREGTRPAEPAFPEGYRPRPFAETDRPALAALLEACGFDLAGARLDEALAPCLPGGVKLIEHAASGALAATMMARHLPSPEFPFGGRIDWLAVHPDHRGRGLGRLAATLARDHLIECGYRRIWVTTQPHRPDAVRIFLGLGFEPTERTRRDYPWEVIEAAALGGA